MKRISGEDNNVKGSVARVLGNGLECQRGEILTVPEDEEFTQDGHPCGKLFHF